MLFKVLILPPTMSIKKSENGPKRCITCHQQYIYILLVHYLTIIYIYIYIYVYLSEHKQNAYNDGNRAQPLKMVF